MVEHERADIWSDPAYARVAAVMRQHAGLSLDNTSNAESAILRALRRLKLPHVDALASQLAEGQARVFETLVDELTVRETYFFRESAQIELLRNYVLPRLLRTRPNGLRVLSAGCSTGEEAYTLAILLDEAGCLENSHIVGTDISHEALRRARQACYRKWSMRDVDERVVQRYFHVSDDNFTVSPRLRASVSYQFLNLCVDGYPSIVSGVWDLDLILCRNVFIYFNRGALRQAAARLYDSLADGGFLLVGPSDPLLEDLPCKPTVTVAGALYQRTSRDVAPSEVSFLVGDVSFMGACPDGRKTARPSAVGGRSPAATANKPQTPPPRVVEPLKAARKARALDTSPQAPPAPDTLAATLARANEALAAGDYQTVLALTKEHTADERALALHLRALSNVASATVVEPAAAQAAQSHPLSVEIHFLHALVLMDSGRDNDAVQALQRVLYLDNSLALAHFFLGVIHARQKDRTAARRAWRNAVRLSGEMPRQATLPLSQGQRAGALYDAARAQLRGLEGGLP